MVFESIEVCRPERAIGGQPLVEVCERLRSDPVEAALCIGPRLNQPRVPENAQMLGNRRLTQAKPADERTDRLLAGAKRLEDRHTARLSKDLKCRKLLHAGGSMPIQLYACQGIS